MFPVISRPRSNAGAWRVLRAVLIVGAGICLSCTDVPRDPAPSGNAEWELVEDLRLDAGTEDFSVIPRLFVGPRRGIVVPEPQDARFRLYDSTGVLVAVIGRSGSGPGEFQHLGGVSWAADTLVTWDAALARATYWLPDGTLARTEAFQFWAPDLRGPDVGARGAYSTFEIFSPVAFDAEGAKLGLAYLAVWTDGERSVSMVVLRVSRDGAPLVLASPPQWDDERWSVTVSGVTNPVPFAFQPRTEFAPDGSRFLFATTDQSSVDGGTLDLTVLRPAGDTVFARSLSYGGEPIPAAAMDSAIAGMLSESGRTRLAKALARERAPAVHAPLDVTLGLDGTVWVELRSADPGRRVVVLSAEGDRIGSLRMPPRSKIQQASIDNVWVIETDAMDLTSVVRYRVIRPG